MRRIRARPPGFKSESKHGWEYYDDGLLDRVQLYATDIITITRSGTKLNTGGHRTHTTKSWLNAYLTDHTIVQKDYDWYVCPRGHRGSPKKKCRPFRDGMTILD